MNKKLKIFKWVLANFAIVLVATGLIALAVSGSTVNVFKAEESPIYKGYSSQKVALMINVYWGTEYLDSMLQTLKESSVKATFFVGGSWAAKNEDMLKRFQAEGHEIGNHGYFHKDHKKLDAAKNLEEIKATHVLVKEILDIDMTLFAPPSGSFSKTTLEQARQMGYDTIMWSKDTIDWRDHDTELIYSRATKKVEGGDLILMHPTKNTAEALSRIIKTIEGKGLSAATVSEVIAK